MFRDVDADERMGALFGMASGTEKARRAFKARASRATNDDLQRSSQRGELPDILSVSLKGAPPELQLAQASGLYTAQPQVDQEQPPEWVARYNGYRVASRYARGTRWQLLNSEGFAVAESESRKGIETTPPHELEWHPVPPTVGEEPVRFTIKLTGENAPTMTMTANFAKRMASLHEVFGLRHPDSLRMDRVGMTEMANRVRSFLERRSLQKIVRIRVIATRSSQLIACVKKAQDVQRAWHAARNARFDRILHEWQADDAGRRAKLVSWRSKSKHVLERMHEFQKKVEAIDATTDMHRRAAIVHLYRARIVEEYAAGRRSDEAMETKGSKKRAALKAMLNVRAGVLNRVLPISREGVADPFKRTQKTLGDVRTQLAALELKWKEDRCASMMSSGDLVATGDPFLVQTLVPEGTWTLEVLKWAPPVLRGGDLSIDNQDFGIDHYMPSLSAQALRKASVSRVTGRVDTPAVRRASFRTEEIAARGVSAPSGVARPTSASALKTRMSISVLDLTDTDALSGEFSEHASSSVLSPGTARRGSAKSNVTIRIDDSHSLTHAPSTSTTVLSPLSRGGGRVLSPTMNITSPAEDPFAKFGSGGFEWHTGPAADDTARPAAAEPPASPAAPRRGSASGSGPASSSGASPPLAGAAGTRGAPPARGSLHSRASAKPGALPQQLAVSPVNSEGGSSAASRIRALKSQSPPPPVGAIDASSASASGGGGGVPTTTRRPSTRRPSFTPPPGPSAAPPSPQGKDRDQRRRLPRPASASPKNALARAAAAAASAGSPVAHARSAKKTQVLPLRTPTALPAGGPASRRLSLSNSGGDLLKATVSAPVSTAGSPKDPGAPAAASPTPFGSSLARKSLTNQPACPFTTQHRRKSSALSALLQHVKEDRDDVDAFQAGVA